MYIGYDKKHGKEYAKLYTSKRNGKNTSKDYQNLGLVLDKERGIYQNRTRGVFIYNLEDNTYGKPPDSFVPVVSHPAREKLILDFGDVFLLQKFIDSSGLLPIIDGIGYGNPDTLYSMICYYILCFSANCYANSWWEGSYARILYPNANLSSQRISDFLGAIGEERAMRMFFDGYLQTIGGKGPGVNILIDSTGLPNSIHFPLTAISNHNGDISNEVRLIYITEQKTGLPIYFRYCPGNVVDVTTLIRTIKELKQKNIKIFLAILDAGYYSNDNILALYKEKIHFVTRLRENKRIYKDLTSKYADSLVDPANIVAYNGRFLYIKRIACQLVDGYRGYAYLALDIERKGDEARNLFRKATVDGIDPIDVHYRMLRQGIFILVSSKRLEKSEILPIYYERQMIEQVFDIGKNYANMIPLRVHGEPTFRGHLMLTFISTVVLKMLQNKLKDSPYNPISLFKEMRNHKCKVYNDRIITNEPFKKANDGYKLFGITCPVEIPKGT
jgi:hypothetical protein